MNRVLIIEESNYAKRLREELLDRFEVHTESHIEHVGESMEILRPDIVILDIGLDYGNGLNLLRQGKITTPTIVLTSIDDDNAHIECLDLGAKDYLVKPVSTEVIAKHIEIRLNSSVDRYLRSGKLTIDTLKRIISYNGKSEKLTATEYDILVYLFRNSESYHTAEDIYEVVYNDMFLCSTSMKMHLSHLRAKLLKIAPTESFISTVYGKGYRFIKN